LIGSRTGDRRFLVRCSSDSGALESALFKARRAFASTSEHVASRWRWTGSTGESSTRDIRDGSIACRNGGCFGEVKDSRSRNGIGLVSGLIHTESQSSVVVTNCTRESHKILGNDISCSSDSQINASNVRLCSSFLIVMQSNDLSSKKVSSWGKLRRNSNSHCSIVRVEGIWRSPLDGLVISCGILGDSGVKDLEPSQTTWNSGAVLPSSHVGKEGSSMR